MLETTVPRNMSTPTNERCEDMPSLNHSYIYLQIMKQLLLNEEIEPLPELTLDIANRLTPDISVFPKSKIQPNLFHDVPRFQEKPILAIEVVSSSQTIQEMLQTATHLVNEGVNAVWTVEPYTRTVFITTKKEENLFHENLIETEGIQVDFSKVFLTRTSN
jgi:Uma2 family endonuclease